MKWDLSLEHNQKRAIGMLRRDSPSLVICSPPCTMSSNLQDLAGDPRDRCPRKLEAAARLVEFAAIICEERRKARILVYLTTH